jgi:hypothetical protein
MWKVTPTQSSDTGNSIYPCLISSPLPVKTSEGGAVADDHACCSGMIWDRANWAGCQPGPGSWEFSSTLSTTASAGSCYGPLPPVPGHATVTGGPTALPAQRAPQTLPTKIKSLTTKSLRFQVIATNGRDH